jgi:hypothetical protein
MSDRRVLVYYAWSRPAEVEAPLDVIENRFPTLFESRRMLFPRFEEFSDPERFNQGVAGFLDHIMKHNFTAFVDFASRDTGRPVIEVERVADAGPLTPLNANLLRGIDTLIVISFDSLRTGQEANTAEIEAVRGFLAKSDNVAFICPHHDIGEASGLDHDARLLRQEADFLHHGDKTIPPQQRFGGFARTLLAGLGALIENRFGLHPAAEPDGSPTPILVDQPRDRLHLLDGVKTFNLHPHLPHMERLGDAAALFDVLARQKIDLSAPPHPFTSDGRDTFDALLQSRPDVFAGALLVGDATLWSSTAGGVESLRQLWVNVVGRKPAPVK